MTINEQNKLRSIIREMVEEFVSDYYNEFDEAKKKKKNKTKKLHHKEDDDNDKDEKKSNDRDGKPGKESDASLNKDVHKRHTVISALKNRYFDCAQYAYKLWPELAGNEDDKKNCRSQFYKCRDGEVNDNGVPYSFTASEINTLYSMLFNFEKKREK